MVVFQDGSTLEVKIRLVNNVRRTNSTETIPWNSRDSFYEDGPWRIFLCSQKEKKNTIENKKTLLICFLLLLLFINQFINAIV